MTENAEKNWTQLWLNYIPKKEHGNIKYIKNYCICGFRKKLDIIGPALYELGKGVKGMLGVEPEEVENSSFSTGLMIIQKHSMKEKHSMDEKHSMEESPFINEGEYRLSEEAGTLLLEASDGSGLLYGVFHILRLIAMEKSLKGTNVLCRPDNPLRMLNHWDNMKGSIERGYSGESFFFNDNKMILDERTRDYARLAASVGINGVVINNVNVNDAATWLITPKYLNNLKKLSELFTCYGIRLFLSLNFAASMSLGGPDSADPLDEQVITWWQQKITEVYTAIPNLGGFLVKADSEGRPGPFTYGRTQADGANMLADLVKPYGGVIIWRCFVYNCTQDWRDYKTDRARAGYDNFIHMDGDYHDNVILQIKNGPMDFQIREPVSPLLGGLKKTNQMLEVQAAQEYTGHQIDVCYLIPLFKEVLDFNTYCAPQYSTVADVISGRTFGNGYAGMAAVSNTGNDENWTGNDLAAANFYGFGRLAFSTSLTAEEIAEEWIRMTFLGRMEAKHAMEEDHSMEEDHAMEVLDTLKQILMESRSTYEKYTSPLGIGWMVNPHIHYGPSVDGYEYSRWGTYHRADHLGVGVDRTDSGTGYAGQYYEPNASMYNNIETCPEELLLFFHHVPYTHRLKNGKTLIQHIYDSHFEGVEEVKKMIAGWESLEGKVPEDSYVRVRERFEKQLWNAREWRDQVNSYFFRKSGIEDERGRMIY